MGTENALPKIEDAAKESVRLFGGSVASWLKMPLDVMIAATRPLASKEDVETALETGLAFERAADKDVTGTALLAGRIANMIDVQTADENGLRKFWGMTREDVAARFDKSVSWLGVCANITAEQTLSGRLPVMGLGATQKAQVYFARFAKPKVSKGKVVKNRFTREEFGTMLDDIIAANAKTGGSLKEQVKEYFEAITTGTDSKSIDPKGLNKLAVEYGQLESDGIWYQVLGKEMGSIVLGLTSSTHAEIAEFEMRVWAKWAVANPTASTHVSEKARPGNDADRGVILNAYKESLKTPAPTV
jgi:hypothetical protein